MEDDLHKLMKDLYEALMKRDQTKVIELYRMDVKIDENTVIKPYHLEVKYSEEYPLTAFHDTVLHVAIYSGQNELVKYLINKVIPNNESDILKQKNDLGDTILHEAATNEKIDIGTVDLMLTRQADLLMMRNNNGESPLFRAVHFGNMKMVNDLATRVAKLNHSEVHLRRQDGVTILHIAILTESYDLALEIAKKYGDLPSQRDQVGMTGLHLLSSMPSAFKSGFKHQSLKRFIYFCVPDGDIDHKSKSKKLKRLLPPQYDTCIEFFKVIAVGLRRLNLLLWNRLFKGWPVMEEIWKEKRRHESSLKLAKYLVKDDLSWQESDPGGDPEKIVIASEHVNKHPEDTIHKGHRSWKKLVSVGHFLRHSHQNPGNTNIPERRIIADLPSPTPRNPSGITELDPSSDLMAASSFEKSFEKPTIGEQNIHKPETPLLVATSNGIVEIVKEILKVFPQAIEHISYTGQNVLHVAVKNRQMEIFDLVKKRKIPMTRLARRIDKKGNTALHQIGNTVTYRGDMPGPALQLQEELLWFKLVKDVLPSHFRMHLNEDGLNAYEYFERSHSVLLQQAQDWLKRTSQSCSVVAVLIATVAFAAAYTVPGGNQDSGLPILIGEPFFLVFTVMDVVSLASSLTSVVMFLSILTSPFQFHDFKRSLPRKLTFGFAFLFISVATMMLAFAATIILTIQTNRSMSRILIYSVAFLPVSIFALLQFPLYLALFNTAQYSLHLIKKALPSSNCYARCLKSKTRNKTR